MGQAAIVKYGAVVKIDGLTDPVYTINGFLNSFSVGGVKYRETSNSDFRKEDQYHKYAVGGFYEEQFFLEYLAKKKDRELYRLKEHCYQFDYATSDDEIVVKKLKIEEPYTEFCTVETYQWTHQPNTVVVDLAMVQIIIPPGITPNQVENIQLLTTAMEFYSHKIGLFVTPLTDAAERYHKAYLLAKTALRINQIIKDVFLFFNTDVDLGTYISSQLFQWSYEPIFINPAIEDLRYYYEGIHNFYISAYRNKIVIQGAPKDKKLYWLAYCLSSQALSTVPVDNKCDLLRKIAKGNIKGETAHFFGEVNEEAFVLKIIRSFTNTNVQIEPFLNELISLYYEGDNQDNSLFEILYSKMHDRGFGQENLKEMMNVLYQKWILSSYYPYNFDLEETVKDNLINNTIYNSKPINIEYKASDFLWIFNSTNYDFDFNGNKIDVKEGESTIGSYDIFQTITIKNTDDNTENTKFITTNIGEEQKAILPIFYLKYIDDKKFTENLVTAAELTFDLALTATGIGNLAKLRHLKHITPFGRVALGLEAPGTNLIRYELAQGVAGLIEVSSSVASILLTYGDTYKNTYCNTESQSYDPEKCEFYTKLDVVVTVMQIFSGGLDYATSRQLRNASKKILDGPIPADFDPDALIILQKFAGNINQIENLFRGKIVVLFGENSPILTKLDNLPTSPINKQEMFLLDFERATDGVLGSLNNNGVLIDRWSDLMPFGLVNERKSIAFLSNETRVTAHIRYYGQPPLRQVLEQMSDNKRLKFLDEMGEISQTNLDRLVNKPDLANQWLRYYEDLTLRANFQILNKTKQIDFLEIFGEMNGYWFNRFKRDPDLFNRFNIATGNSLTLASQNPKLWIKINRYYTRPGGLLLKLSDSQILSKFGQKGLTLVNAVESNAQQLIRNKSRSNLSKDHTLVSGMIDKETGEISELLTNFTREELEPGGLYSIFLEIGTNPNLNMHPNLRSIVNELEGVGQSLYNIDNAENLVFTGHNIAAHAEVRALDSLIKKKFGTNAVNEDIFNEWIQNNVLGYNRNIVAQLGNNNFIMHTCADCFYITDLVTFIK